MLSKLTRGNQVTIPKIIAERAGLKVGRDYVDVEYAGGVIYLKPVDIEERIPKEDLEKLRKKALEQESGDITLTAKDAADFLSRRVKKR
ncbi:MAG TPA: hypothetical protein DCL49_04840 [Candidatus Omnitrophica bacterium]|nr:hypothetical protein [Candidatus Omnitrophota bacterium]